MIKSDYVFEISWEICNKRTGVHKALLMKAGEFSKKYSDKYILIGPDRLGVDLENKEFIEDKELFAQWREIAAREGIFVRIGRWDVVGKPIVFLLDFSNFISKKDEIFKSLWEKYKLDSISGQWDYVEYTTFGYGVGKLIECFDKFENTLENRISANFHDRHSVAGLLYLKYYAPEIAAIYTLHTVSLGKSLFNEGVYDYMAIDENIVKDKISKYGIISKQSLETIGLNIADVTVTTSNLTGNQLAKFFNKKTDFIIPNSFSFKANHSVIPSDKRKNQIRAKLKLIAEAILCNPISAKTKFVFTSGSYNPNNDSIDLLLSSLKEMQNNKNIDIVFFILVPANVYGKREDLFNKISTGSDEIFEDKILTHALHEQEFDPILRGIKKYNFQNTANDRVKIIYSPAFLDGNDGIYDIPYNEIIYEFDNAIFTSYDSDWGYSSVEALAAGVPVIMSDLFGYGNWVLQNNMSDDKCIRILERQHGNGQLQHFISNIFEECAKLSESEFKKSKESSINIVKEIDIIKLMPQHQDSINKALEKVEGIRDTSASVPKNKFLNVKTFKSNNPIWRSLSVKPEYSGNLKGLDELSKNLWWAWNYKAVELFGYIRGESPNCKCTDPIAILKNTSFEKFSRLENDKKFLKMYNKVYSDFNKYMAVPFNEELPSIAYFSMEYGLANLLRIYSGGLGVLAGDYLKQASDSCYNMTAVGLLYRQGYFTQQITINGEQAAVYENQIFNELPAELVKDENGVEITVEIAFPGRIVKAQIWKVPVGRINLYLLDTDREDNREDDRSLTHRLYGGDNEHRLKQEIILGIGGIRALHKLNIQKDVYHCNEGHAAFIGIERMNNIIGEKYSFAEALEIVRASSLFTTHTPVPAGHDTFSEDLIMTYIGHFHNRLNISREEFINLGRQANINTRTEEFSMSFLAANLSQSINGVSKLHGKVSRDVIFNNMWDGYFPDELHIGYVTNGVHYSTWTSKGWQELLNTKDNKPDFEKIKEISDKKIWNTKQKDKANLIKFIKNHVEQSRITRNENPKVVQKIKSTLSENVLTIGFARRFATYKRGNLLFRDLNRLNNIVNNSERPVQFVFAGKAHPLDAGGQAIIKQIIEYSKRPEFLGKIIFLEDYKMSLAKELVQGVDIWLNTPTRPLEASGTSGMKAVMNGALNLSVLDGWWVEGYKEDAGWALSEKRTYDNQEMQDDLDAEVIYQLLENDITQLYYNRDTSGIPTGWVKYIRKCILKIAPEFTTARMIHDYQERYYSILHERSKKMAENNYALAKETAVWKKKMRIDWEQIEVKYLSISEPVKDPVVSGEKYYGELILDVKDIKQGDIGAEILITETNQVGEQKIIKIDSLEPVKQEGGLLYFDIKIQPTRPGVFNYAFRIFPINDNLPHRQDFCYVKWL